MVHIFITASMLAGMIRTQSKISHGYLKRSQNPIESHEYHQNISNPANPSMKTTINPFEIQEPAEPKMYVVVSGTLEPLAEKTGTLFNQISLRKMEIT